MVYSNQLWGILIKHNKRTTRKGHWYLSWKLERDQTNRSRSFVLWLVESRSCNPDCKRIGWIRESERGERKRFFYLLCMSCLISSQVLILPTCLILLTHSDFLKYWKRTWNWRYGNCYTFNSGATEDGKKTPVLTSTKPGPQYGNGVICFIVNLLEEIGKLVQIQPTTFPQGRFEIDWPTKPSIFFPVRSHTGLICESGRVYS